MVDSVCIGVDFAFNLHPLLTLPIVQDRKWIKKASLFEPKASFEAFPFFVLLNWVAEGQWQRGRLSLLTFFGEAKKVSSCRSTTDLQPPKSSQRFGILEKIEARQIHKSRVGRKSCPPYARYENDEQTRID